MLKSTEDDSSDDDADDGRSQANSQTTFGNVYLGAPQKQCSFNDLENAHLDDPAFYQFRTCLADMLDELLQ